MIGGKLLDVSQNQTLLRIPAATVAYELAESALALPNAALC
jgi:hypothetical protein